MLYFQVAMNMEILDPFALESDLSFPCSKVLGSGTGSTCKGRTFFGGQKLAPGIVVPGVLGVLPHIDPEIAKYTRGVGNLISDCNMKLMAQCEQSLFQGSG
jgi:hypothetical protein